MNEQVSYKKRHRGHENEEERVKRSKADDKGDLGRYTIGWVCALPKEQTAARAMLDEEFRNVEVRKAAGDTNTYTLGSIRRHNIAIACLPKGQLGVIRASKVAASMTSTFWNIKFVLMVGIGGGIPSGPNDVRLGDVVVGTPTGQYPGVVQWDMGKTKGGNFERTGSLNNPPKFLLTALSKMESDHEMEGTKIQDNLDTMFKKWPRLKAKYERSDTLEDLLFPSNYNHLDRPSDPSSTPASQEAHEITQGVTGCLYCDTAKAKKRAVREPVVHYGLIASGNQVVKDAIYRDELNKNLDSNVLCIEMEAAGLVDDFPCLVIRGICDYADSHKNKAWQEHAAAVAAALTKELLENVHPVEVDNERAIRELQESLANIHSTTLATKDAITKISAQAKRDHDKNILEWLTSIEYGQHQSDFLRRRQPETCTWFLQSSEYLNWLNLEAKSDHTLFCPGIPGAGKTILMSAVIDDVTARFASTQGVSIAYIYCSFQRRQDQDLESLLSSLIKQTARGLAHIPDSLVDLHQKHSSRGTTPLAQELSNVLCSLSDSLSTLFIFVDALDECKADSCSALLSVLLGLQTKTSATIKLFATSREVPAIAKKFEHAQKCEIRATSEDIRSYIKHHLPEILEYASENSGLEETILVEIANLVDGMFLLAQLYLESLKDTTSVGEVSSSLEKFRSIYSLEDGKKLELSRVYDQAYKEAMQRILGQPPNHRDLGRRIIYWITHAWRPLRVTELQHALAVEKGCKKIDENNLRDTRIMISVCAGLVTFDSESGTIRLVHYTTQEFFQRAGETYFPNFHAEISTVCARYLFIAFEGSEGDEADRLCNQRPSFQLLDYAVNGWGYHAAQAVSFGEDIKALLLRPDIMRSISSFIISSLMNRRLPIHLRYPGRLRNGAELPKSGIGWAAYYGLDDAIDLFIQLDADVNQADNSGKTPLFQAVTQGKASFAQRLFQLGANPPKRSLNNLLSRAAKIGNVVVSSMLLEKGAKVEYSSLISAVEAKSLPTVKLLLSKGASAEMTATFSASKRLRLKNLLHMAVELDQAEIARALLEQGVLAHTVDVFGDARQRTPLSVAATHGNITLINLLLEYGAGVDTGIEHGTAPLQVACRDILQLLAKRVTSASDATLYVACSRGDCDTARKWIYGDSQRIGMEAHQWEVALLISAKFQHADIVYLLVEIYAEVENISASQWRRALVYIIQARLGSMAVRLFEKSSNVHLAQVNQNTSEADCVLPNAWQYGCADILKVLMEKGLDYHVLHGREGQPVLLDAIRYRRLDILRLLIEKGADVSGIQEPQNQQALFHAVSLGHYDIAKLLLESGADVGIPGVLRQTALFRCDFDFASLLIDKGIDIEARDLFGKTALINECCLRRPRVGKIKLLIGHGADVNALDGRRINALGYACEKSRREQIPSVELIRALIDAGSGLPGDETAAKNVVSFLKSPDRSFGKGGWSNREAERLVWRLLQNVGLSHAFTSLLFPPEERYVSRVHR